MNHCHDLRAVPRIGKGALYDHCTSSLRLTTFAFSSRIHSFSICVFVQTFDFGETNFWQAFFFQLCILFTKSIIFAIVIVKCYVNSVARMQVQYL